MFFLIHQIIKNFKCSLSFLCSNFKIIIKNSANRIQFKFNQIFMESFISKISHGFTPQSMSHTLKGDVSPLQRFRISIEIALIYSLQLYFLSGYHLGSESK